MKKQAIPPYPMIDIEHLSVAISYLKDDSRLVERSLADGTISLKTEEGIPSYNASFLLWRPALAYKMGDHSAR